MPKLPTVLDGVSARDLTPKPAIMLNVAAEKRAVQGIIPTYYQVDGPAAGTVVGIVLGSVLGFLLIIWLLYSVANINNAQHDNAIQGVEDEVVVRRPRRGSHAHSHAGRSRRSSHTEVREYDRSPRQRPDAFIVEERRAPRQPRPRSIVVDDRRSRSRVPGDDVVEVITEHEDYRERRGSRRYVVR